MRGGFAGVLAMTPSVPAWMSVPNGMPWAAAFSLSLLGLAFAAGMAFYTERHRHTEYLDTVAKAKDNAAIDLNSALRLVRPDTVRWLPWGAGNTGKAPKDAGPGT